jgi:hypothetical protein
VTGQQFAAILAQTDPFDVAQGIERYVRLLSGERVRGLIGAAAPRMNESYRAEFSPLAGERDDERLKRAFARTLKSNLRAIPIFGGAFCEGVISQIPGDRAIGLGEEQHFFANVRPAAIAIAALALLLGGATVHQLFNAARATAQAPVVLSKFTLPPIVQRAHPSAPPVHRAVRRAVIAAALQVPTATPVAAPVIVPQAPHIVRQPHRVLHYAPSLPVSRGVKTIVAARREPTAPPTTSPDDLNVSDMPQSYSDATPMPDQAPAAARVQAPQSFTTPTPGPNRSWTHRLVHAATHLVNSTLTTVIPGLKGHPQPTATPTEPQP